jgi:hypothetical protein
MRQRSPIGHSLLIWQSWALPIGHMLPGVHPTLTIMFWNDPQHTSPIGQLAAPEQLMGIPMHAFGSVHASDII